MKMFDDSVKSTFNLFSFILVPVLPPSSVLSLLRGRFPLAKAYSKPHASATSVFSKDQSC